MENIKDNEQNIKVELKSFIREFGHKSSLFPQDYFYEGICS